MKIETLFVPLAVAALVGLGAPPVTAASEQTGQKPPAQGGAQQPGQKPQPAPPSGAQQPAAKTRTIEGELVSVDQKAHTVAFKDASGKTMTAQLQPRAEKEAAGLKAGDRVRLTCQDNAKGACQVITAVQRVPAAAPSKP